MAVFDLPTRDDGYPAFDFDVELDGEVYNLNFQWNEREGFWYYTLSDEDGQPIISGTKVVADWDLTRGVVDSRRPPGQIYSQDTTGEGADGGLDDMGNRFVVLYADEEEVG